MTIGWKKRHGVIEIVVVRAMRPYTHLNELNLELLNP
jgi:hypothetical protein